MESRFGVGFGDVRIHTGSHANIAARRLGARAFTLGTDIYFGNGAYRPETVEGRRLLAHELAHVVQQSRGSRQARAGSLEVGDPHDPLECEADRVADEVMRAVPISKITPDRAGVIRRAVVIDPASAKITIDKKGAEPDLFVTEKIVHAHLTRGAKGMGDNAPDAGNNFDPAIIITGTFDVILDAGDSFNDFKFGFLQFGNQIVREDVYGGRTENEGATRLNHRLALTQNPALDSDDKVKPFFKNKHTKTDVNAEVQGSKTIFHEKIIIGDHPNVRMPIKVENEKVPAPNFMFSMRVDEGFTTVLTVQDPAGKFQHLAHFSWHLVWHGQMRWRATGAPTKTMITKGFDIGPVKPGAPNDSTLSALLSDPVGPMFNQLTKNATGHTIFGRPPHREEVAKRFPEIPADFFK
jgi:hypothetical protein